MRHYLLRFVCCAVLLSGFPTGSSADYNPLEFIDDSLRQKVQVDLNRASTDDHLLTLARAAKVNVIADATDFDTEAPEADVQWNQYRKFPSILSFLLDLSDQRGLTWARHDVKTFLFWQPPHLESLKQRILAGEDVRLPAASVGVGQLHLSWQKYLQEAHGWDGQRPHFALKVRVADLPSPLREQTIAAIQSHKLDDGFTEVDKSRLQDEVWKTAAVVLSRNTPNRIERLMLLTRTGTSGTFETIDPAPARAPRSTP
ncbi:MAG: hypothetical protein JWN98_1887 [Abditibacteriota bacterium]|nr:hypothetical protein [Abditibacteriota bacterium]